MLDFGKRFASFFFNGNEIMNSIQNMSNSQLVTVEMTKDEMEFLFSLKYIWTTLTAIVTVSSLLFIFYFVYTMVFVPYERIKRLGSVGYLNHESGKLSKRELANLIRKRRKIGEGLPPVYPNGWFRLLDSLQLNQGEAKEVCALGEHFVVFRSQSGKVHILDAYCPHMGANLGVGGLVKGECLECPFHGWVFDGDGKCVDIPYTDKVPEIARTKSWPCREVNGAIFVWYHCDGVAPEWKIPEIPELSKGSYHYVGRTEHHINTHIQVSSKTIRYTLDAIMCNSHTAFVLFLQDIPENGADVGHLRHLHMPFVGAGSDLSKAQTPWLNFTDHILEAECLGSTEEEPHILVVKIKHSQQFFKKWKCFHMNFMVYQIGPGIVHFYIESLLGKSIFCQTLTPVEPLHQVLIHKLYTPYFVPLCFGKPMLYMNAIQDERDVMVWNNKTYKKQPKLIKEEKPIAQFKKWFSQFYTKNSPKFEMKAKDDIQW